MADVVTVLFTRFLKFIRQILLPDATGSCCRPVMARCCYTPADLTGYEG